MRRAVRTTDASPFADARPLNTDRVSGQFNSMGLTESEEGVSEPVAMLEPEDSTPHPLGDDVRAQLDAGDYSRFEDYGSGKKDPLTQNPPRRSGRAGVSSTHHEYDERDHEGRCYQGTEIRRGEKKHSK